MQAAEVEVSRLEAEKRQAVGRIEELERQMKAQAELANKEINQLRDSAHERSEAARAAEAKHKSVVEEKQDEIDRLIKENEGLRQGYKNLVELISTTVEALFSKSHNSY